MYCNIKLLNFTGRL